MIRSLAKNAALGRWAKLLALVLLAWMFLSTGVMHLVKPAPFVRIVPGYFSHPQLLVYVSGVAELIGGTAILFPRTRRVAAVGLIALLLAVFPANINMALHPERFRDIAQPAFFWLRLPVQGVYILWTAWCGNLLPPRRAP